MKKGSVQDEWLDELESFTLGWLVGCFILATFIAGGAGGGLALSLYSVLPHWRN